MTPEERAKKVTDELGSDISDGCAGTLNELIATAIRAALDEAATVARAKAAEACAARLKALPEHRDLWYGREDAAGEIAAAIEALKG